MIGWAIMFLIIALIAAIAMFAIAAIAGAVYDRTPHAP